ncbi:flagellar biosynthesis protein FlhB [Sporolactobacillus spathodeae]|uniref:Flagellar biosynthetic protein FlhB n=1 Tax=Sporolactobacillus spathodeae TaxID=1465502 RepID=A0ABS2Q5A8_9BACL|nr:flagellar biosynthesis protein FlhB [Sporolactobacillus spathodeae]MBM7656963.1 flagellar biosynthetic protein FlhB [Sporolactobacillus spathodeae]
MSMVTLDLQYFAGEKTEKATAHKRSETRKKGEVFKSIDLSTAISLFAFFLYFRIAGATLGRQLGGMMGSFYGNELQMDLTQNNILKLFSQLSIGMLKMLLPVFVLALVVGVLSQLFQIGVLFHPELLLFKGERLSPLSGLKRIYSLRAVVELLKSMLKIIFVGLITFSVIWFQRTAIVQTAQEPLLTAASTISRVFLNMGLIASLALVLLSLLDYFYQKFDFEKKMRMSKQDIKDEYKTIEGDPLIKAKIRERQKQMAMRRMMQELPKADVVITNPTHFAVALQYDAETMSAPTVIAKGADQIAFRIKDIARNHGITIVERKPLARALYAQLDIGDHVPEAFFQAVAEILAYVYRLKGKA